MEHKIEPEESWLLAPWRRKKTYEKVAIILGLAIGVWQSVERFERGYASDWFFMSGYWFTAGWAYFSRSRSREVIVATELELNTSHSAQAERRLPALK